MLNKIEEELANRTIAILKQFCDAILELSRDEASISVVIPIRRFAMVKTTS